MVQESSLLRPSLAQEKNPIVFVHGMWGSTNQFSNWLATTKQAGHKPYTVELSNLHHKNYGEAKKVSIFDYAESVSAVIREIGKPVNLIGHSMGGLIAQIVATKIPKHVLKLVLVSSSPPRWIFPRGKVLAKIFRYLPEILGGKPFLPEREDAYKLLFNRILAKEREEHYEKLRYGSGRVALQILGGVAIPRNLIHCPILVVAGSDDEMTPLSLERAIARHFRAKIEVVNGGGHMLMLEEASAERTIEIILKWLGE